MSAGGTQKLDIGISAEMKGKNKKKSFTDDVQIERVPRSGNEKCRVDRNKG